MRSIPTQSWFLLQLCKSLMVSMGSGYWKSIQQSWFLFQLCNAFMFSMGCRYWKVHNYLPRRYLYGKNCSFKYVLCLLPIVFPKYLTPREMLVTHSLLLVEIYWKSHYFVCPTTYLMSSTHNFVVSNKF